MLEKDAISFRTLTIADLKQMHPIFNLAFSDYPIQISISYDQFLTRFLHKQQIDFGLSVGAFCDELMVGFIFTAIGNYEGKNIAYNGGTGVIPSFRGNRLTERMYKYLFPLLKTRSIDCCLLEVLTGNDRALVVYEKAGFKTTKIFRCFRKELATKANRNNPKFKTIKKLKNPDWELFTRMADTSPSFLDSFEVLSRNIHNEEILIYQEKEKLLGYAIYQPEIGRISQIAVDKDFRRRGIGTVLVNYMLNNSGNGVLTAMNVNTECGYLVDFFLRLGFENQFNQYEMVLPLS